MAVLKCCQSDYENGSNVVRNTILLGIALSVSFILLLVAGIVDNNWLPMINLGAIVLVPMAVIISDVMGGGSMNAGIYDESRQAWINFGGCFFGIILASLFGLPLVLLHVGALKTFAFALWMASTVVTFFASSWYWIQRQSKEY